MSCSVVPIVDHDRVSAHISSTIVSSLNSIALTVQINRRFARRELPRGGYGSDAVQALLGRMA